MASAELKAELLCSVCMEVYTDPATLPCGHSFCRDCITQTWEHQEHVRKYKCPECMKIYQRRPELKRNLRLHNIAEAFLRSQRAQEETGIFCTYCDSSVLAVKSCLKCETSMCDDHLRKHNRTVQHPLTAPVAALGKHVCPVHKKALSYYCTQDSACICITCRLDGGHIGHQVEPVDEASRKKKEKLRNLLQKANSERQEAEKRAESLKDHRRNVEEKTASVIVKVVALIGGMRRQLDEVENKVLSDISRQQEQISLSVSNLIRQLEMDKNKLVQKMSQIQKLLDTTDLLSFLQDADRGDFFKETDKEREEDRDRYEDDMDDGVILQTLCTHLYGILPGSDVWFSVQDPSDILLDVTTAGNNVDIADHMKTARYSQEDQKYPQKLERFECSQVMSVRNFSSGRHYWEVEVSSAGWWMVGLCYPSIERRGACSWIGNNKSWCLYRSNNVYFVAHNSRAIPLPQKSSSNRLTIHLDCEAGRLTFYERRNPMRHLHTFTTTFTEPICAAFSVCKDTIYNGDGWVKIISSSR
ncbi:PREDICTED: E3 ubiquitin/ISG15 ligase TRIM25-like [Nanorana parkeri]|uniref:E3 ubiquitin/ISG15 ligase TRIM25-like n=1 Tax=Nanorana parkeri TaxID=125878 RepID=UPI000854453E|nr:PREDICTED: E3 ubiquitin/ISG15 ligase TRIM25-like [Nanorana parkeri]